MVQHRRSANEGAALTFKPSFFPLAADAAALPAVSHLPCLFDAASEDGLLRALGVLRLIPTGKSAGFSPCDRAPPRGQVIGDAMHHRSRLSVPATSERLHSCRVTSYPCVGVRPSWSP